MSLSIVQSGPYNLRSKKSVVAQPAIIPVAERVQPQPQKGPAYLGENSEVSLFDEWWNDVGLEYALEQEEIEKEQRKRKREEAASKPQAAQPAAKPTVAELKQKIVDLEQKNRNLERQHFCLSSENRQLRHRMKKRGLLSNE
jgi:hypothetical protein